MYTLFCFYSQQNPTNTEADARDLLQLALDRICEMQRKLTQRDSCATGNFLEDITGRPSTENISNLISFHIQAPISVGQCLDHKLCVAQKGRQGRHYLYCKRKITCYI
jgi:hypothetical protein